MDTPEAQPDPMVIAQNELRALIEQKTGPFSDLRLRLIDERGVFGWTATLVESRVDITGTCTLTLATDGVDIWTEVEEIAILGRGVIRRIRWTPTTTWAEIIGGSAAMVDAGGARTTVDGVVEVSSGAASTSAR
jgi:hypothetical protein